MISTRPLWVRRLLTRGSSWAIGALIVSSAGCHRGVVSSEETSAPAKEGPLSPAKSYRCDLEVWADTASSRNQIEVQKLRTKIMAEAGETAMNLSRAGQDDLDKYTEGATFCVVSSAEPRPLRVVTFEGHFPADLLERWGGSVSDARFESIDAVKVLRKGDAWFAQANGKILWADSRDGLEAGLRGRLRAGDLDRSKGIAVRLKPKNKLLDIGRLAEAFGVEASDWEFVTVSSDRGGKVSDLVVTAKSPASATRSLEVMRSLLDDLSANRAKLPPGQVERLSAEATGSGASLRFGGSLPELLQFLSQLTPRSATAHHHHP